MCDKAAPAMHVPIEGLFSDAPEKSFAQGLREQAAVLLRGRLLLQPDGLEGFGAVGVLAPTSDLPVAHGAKDGVAKLRFHAACLRRTPDVQYRYNASIVHVDKFFGHRADVVERVDPVLEIATQRLWSLDLAHVVNRTFERPPVDVGRPEVGHSVQSARSEGVEGIAHNVHVLLRHRHTSIPPVWERRQSAPRLSRGASGGCRASLRKVLIQKTAFAPDKESKDDVLLIKLRVHQPDSTPDNEALAPRVGLAKLKEEAGAAVSQVRDPERRISHLSEDGVVFPLKPLQVASGAGARYRRGVVVELPPSRSFVLRE